MSIQVSALNVYPVKSLAGSSVDSAVLRLPGLEFDRRWMVVSPTGDFITQRTHPQMALVETKIVRNKLVLECFGMDSHIVADNQADMARLDTAVWGDPVQALDVGEETAGWLSQAIGDDCRMVVFPATAIRRCSGDRSLPSDHTRFADGFPLLIVSEESLQDLNGRLDHAVEMKRFRPNLVVRGCDPFAEDGWRVIRIGELSIRILEGCARCSVPTVDPSTGVLTGPEPIHTMNSFRRRGGEVYFGVNAAADQEGEIKVGDDVEIIK